jgi:CheY-like chemotaxis protein
MAKAKDDEYYRFVHELNAEIADAIAQLNQGGPDHPQRKAREARVSAAVHAMHQFTVEYQQAGEGGGAQGPVRVLILEDNALDAELMIRELRRAGLEVEANRVESEIAFAAALVAEPDLVLSDNAVPTFGSREALGLLRSKRQDTPFIVVSGAIPADVAAQLLLEGADDCVLKNELNRLGTVALQALKKRAN